MTAAENYDLARTKSLSYTVASNLYTLRDRYTGVPDGIVKKILDFEEVDGVRQLDPFDARRGHWILIYGVLQILATVGVDTPGLRFKEGIEYHLSPPMTGIVPWAAEGWPAEPEATHELSYCWTVPATWGPPSSGRTLGTDPRINLTIGRQHMNSPSGEITKEDRPNGDKTKRNEGKGKASVGDRTYGHRSSSSLTITGNGVGSSRQAVAWKPVAIASSADGKTWIEEDDGIEGEAGPSTAPEPVDKRRRAEEWVASDASGVGFGGDGAADLNEASFQDGSSIGNSYNLREAYENRNGGHETLIVGVGVADGNPPNGRLSLAARRRRAQIHGFSTFEAPQGW